MSSLWKCDCCEIQLYVHLNDLTDEKMTFQKQSLYSMFRVLRRSPVDSCLSTVMPLEGL